MQKMFHNYFADNTNKRSVAARLRKQRFQLFTNMLNSIPPIVNVLDVGGTQGYWEMVAKGSSLLAKVQVTLLNIQPLVTTLPNFTSMVGDARAMPQFADKQFDIVFSNSTIEHVSSFSDQKNIADEVIRVGKHYYVQTPNRYFPIEPHFVFPFFQFLPISIRVWLVQNFKLGWFPKITDYQKALSEVIGIRLMTKTEVKILFPDAAIFEEKYFGLVKSFIAYTRD
jgi:2-polyprenyl-3-methyl-5-hydroxy-6-metoxy-1,4-benzoquinol methylase